jgi:hypothetical protein
MPARRLLSVLLVFALSDCTTHADDLRRAQNAFAAARYEDVEVWLRDLEPELGRMDVEERATYFYLAGMSAYRMGHRACARHALALCREESAALKHGLPEQWRRNLDVALRELAPSVDPNEKPRDAAATRGEAGTT